MRKVFLCCTGIDDFLNGSSKVAGIQVQMSFWALVIQQNGYECFTYSLNGCNSSINNISFIPKKNISFIQKIKLASIYEWCSLTSTINKIKPDVVIIRGASASLRILSKLCKKKRIKLLMFGASDSDFVPDREILTNKINVKLFRQGVRNTDYFVVQNSFQQKTLFENYGKSSLLLPNIWLGQSSTDKDEIVYDAIWVSNLRRLKRAEWFVNLATTFPDYHFAIVGGVNDLAYYNEILKQCAEISNIDFLGAKPFDCVNELLRKSKMLVCTSEFEGFPNTFLQAWAQGLPTISTVDPNGIIQKHQIGIVIQSKDDLKKAFDQLINDIDLYQKCKQNVISYFQDNHSAQTSYEKLSQYIGN